MPRRSPTRPASPRPRPGLRALCGLALALGLTGCATVGPDYREPEARLPAEWDSAAPAEGALETEALERWWQGFGDPVLEGLVRDALAANLDLATARAKVREARARRALAGAELGPSLDASASASRSRSSEQTGGGSTRELYSAGFDAAWEADVFGRLRRGAEAAQAELDAAEATLRDTQVTLAAEVALNYLDLRTAERRLAVAEASLATRGETYAITRWRLAAGLVSALDEAQSRTDLEAAEATLPALRNAINEARNRLALLLARAPGELRPRLAATARIPHAPRALAVGIPAEVLRQRPDVRVAERRLAAQTARLGAAQAARYPSFRLSGSLGLEALTLGALAGADALGHSLLGSIGAPIFDAGRITAQIDVQDALLEQARLGYETAVLTALKDVETALVALAESERRLGQLERAVGAARQTLEIAEQRYRSGLVDFLAVLESQRTLFQLEETLASSSGQRATDQVRLYKALGGGWSPSGAAEAAGAAGDADNGDAS